VGDVKNQEKKDNPKLVIAYDVMAKVVYEATKRGKKYVKAQ
jgi:hypothetical protein